MKISRWTLTAVTMFGLTSAVACASAQDASPPPEAIRAAVATAMPRVRACYDQHLATHPQAEGRIVLRFTIDPSGAVRDVTVASADEPIAAIGSCAREALSSATVAMPPSAHPVSVTYPFVFRAGGPT